MNAARSPTEDRGGEAVIYLLLTYAGIALGFAILLSAALWAIEIVFGRRIGVYLSYATILTVASFAVWLVYDLLRPCEFVEVPPRHPCEWRFLYFILLGSLILLTIPSLVLSTMRLRKWSDTRRKTLA
jgi:H+/Cl- antiporter ClcA